MAKTLPIFLLASFSALFLFPGPVLGQEGAQVQFKGIEAKTIEDQNSLWASPLDNSTDFGRPDCKLSPFGCLTPPPPKAEKRAVVLTPNFFEEFLSFLCNLPFVGSFLKLLKVDICRQPEPQVFRSDPQLPLPAASMTRQFLYPQGIEPQPARAEGEYIKPGDDNTSYQIGEIEALTAAPGGVFQIFKPMGIESLPSPVPENKLIYFYQNKEEEKMVPDNRLEEIESENNFLQQALWP